ncbi:MAG: carboxypeptidase-like regulatory domain-containing protein [Bacteroidota bacterium]
MKIALQLLCQLLVWSAFGQTSLSGYLIEEDTGKPVEFATAYINGTTIGAVSDEKGFFELKKVSYPLDLVVSHLSYESAVVHLEAAPQEELKVKLKSRTVTLSSIKVEDNDLRQRNVRDFIANFIGLDEFGQEAKLTNDQVLLFEKEYVQVKSPGSNVAIKIGGKEMVKSKPRERAVNMKVSAQGPLVIDQPMLGYKIRVDLEAFQINYAYRLGETQSVYWLGYYFFEPYKVEKERLQKRYDKNREKAYYHSPQHFLKALYNQSLGENGYQIYERRRGADGNSIERFDISPFLKYTDDGMLVIVGLKDKRLDVLYYPKANGKPKNVSKKGKGLPLQSLVEFIDTQCIIRSDGTMPGYSLRFGGQIAEKKVGAMLPENYEVEQSNN